MHVFFSSIFLFTRFMTSFFFVRLPWLWPLLTVSCYVGDPQLVFTFSCRRQKFILYKISKGHSFLKRGWIAIVILICSCFFFVLFFFQNQNILKLNKTSQVTTVSRLYFCIWWRLEHVMIRLRNSVQKHYQAGRGYTPGFNKNCLSSTTGKCEVESCLPGEGERKRGADLCFHKHNFT